MAFLELVKGYAPGIRFELEGERATIGRSAECEVAIDVPAVSRRHAAISIENGRFYIEDLQSRNGTFLNDQRILQRSPLHDGDQVLICDQEFRFHDKHRDAPLDVLSSLESSSNAEIVDDTVDGSKASVMATLDVTSGSASWGLSAKPEVKLAALIEISTSLAQTFSVSDILPKLLDSLFKIFTQADRGFVVMRPKPDGPLVPVAVKTRRPGDEEKLRISRTIVEEAMKSRKAILSADAASDERFSMAQSIADFSIRSMICAPMMGTEGTPLGVIQIDTLNQKARFTDQDLEVLVSVASQAAVAIDNAKMHEQVVAQRALQRDLELARRMQRTLLPSKPPNVPGYFFFDYYQAARQVGGDYYDYVPLPGGRHAVIVGDVAGKGVPAALLMARLSADVRFSLASEEDPAKAVQQINEGFAHHDWQDRFVTMIAAVLNPKTNELTMVNAGHMAPLLRRRGGAVEEIGEDAAGLPLGKHILDDVRKFANGYDQSDDMCLVCFGRAET
jgi:pSer/pThr/pTyr-binding forkhead associated (FHA) protein